MAEAVIVEFVLGKLLNVIANEAQFLLSVKEKVQRAERELTRIKCCLKDADAKRKQDERVKNWLDELRNAAYRIEDATDTFFLQIEGNRQNGPSFRQKLKKSSNKLLEVRLLHQLGTELDDIQNVLKEISQSRIDYGIKELKDESEEEAVEMRHRRTIDSEIDENEVIGMLVDKSNILRLLPSKETPWQAIITITGPGGLGKTTLAQMVYKSAMKDFEYHIMLPISQRFKKKELLIKMLRQNKEFNLGEKDTGELINELKHYLSTRRYLILLDDVWGRDLWDQLQGAFPKVNNGSCILVTSRSTDVVQSSDFKMKLYKLGILDREESRDLLLKKALPYGEKCSNDLFEIADKLSKKCNGLPLALIVLGGILLSKGKSSIIWESIFQKMDWYSDGKGCIDVLAMSYQDMPHCLKPCFLYLSSFPEDYEISAKFLIKMWVVEGFIPCEGRSTVEETAQKYLEQLSERSMIQVSRRTSNGLIKYFKLHDLIRELAMHEAEQQNIVTVFLEEPVVNKPKSGIRRASVQTNNTQSVKYVEPNTRSFLCFSGLLNKSLPKCSNFKLLKVLVLVGVTFYPEDLKGLIHLKFLGIRDSISGDSRSSLFRHMRILETLVMQDFTPEIHWLEDLWTISTLKHVRYTHSAYKWGFHAANSTAYLTNLQTLKWVDLSTTLGGNLSHSNNLRKLGVRIRSRNCWESTMTNLLQKLPSLISLGIDGLDGPEPIIFPKTLSNYQNLQSLHLHGNLFVGTLEASFLPPNLIKLELQNSYLKQNPMPELGKLRHLKKLILQKELFHLDYRGDFSCPVGFPVLQFLQLNIYYAFCELIVEKGVMPNLTNLTINNYIKYRLPTELQHVTVNYYFLGYD